MAGSHPAKCQLEEARVFIHVKEDASGATVTHIDVEHPDLNEIIGTDENTFFGGKEGGVFIGLKEGMIDRAEAYVGTHE